MIRVLLADDQELVRRGLESLLCDEEDIEVVGHAATGAEAVERALTTRPDVILMDIRMPGLDGVAATERITRDDRLADTRIVMLTTFDLDQYVYGAIRAGASGFLLKDTAPAQLLEAIRVATAGEALIAPSITRRLIEELAHRPNPTTTARRLKVLTEREIDILTHVGRGRSNSQIAQDLFISPHTVKTHVSRIMAKLAARARAQLVVAAYETGLVIPGDAQHGGPGDAGDRAG